MYAVIKTGGKQYRVTQGDKLRVESLAAEEGETITIDQVLMTGDGSSVVIGNPLVDNSSVTAVVLSHGRGKKVNIIKFKRRKHHRKQMGHRQNYTELEITEINGVAGDTSKSASSAPASNAGKSESATEKSNTQESNTQKSATEKSNTEKSSTEKSNTGKLATEKSATDTAGSIVDASGTDLKFLDAPEGTPDDLKKILGIGSVLEEKLNGMGIYHYHQIAAFTESDVQNINAHLNFPGRIERDEWIPQAQELTGGGTGRSLKYLDAPEGEKDNLKLISGVGPVLEDKLNELGIFHFWQIAKFEARDIDLVNEAMAFPGRIERDDWIAQAKSLANGGEPK